MLVGTWTFIGYETTSRTIKCNMNINFDLALSCGVFFFYKSIVERYPPPSCCLWWEVDDVSLSPLSADDDLPRCSSLRLRHPRQQPATTTWCLGLTRTLQSTAREGNNNNNNSNRTTSHYGPEKPVRHSYGGRHQARLHSSSNGLAATWVSQLR